MEYRGVEDVLITTLQVDLTRGSVPHKPLAIKVSELWWLLTVGLKQEYITITTRTADFHLVYCLTIIPVFHVFSNEIHHTKRQEALAYALHDNTDGVEFRRKLYGLTWTYFIKYPELLPIVHRHILEDDIFPSVVKAMKEFAIKQQQAEYIELFRKLNL
jgi:hypothetical protein